MKLNEPRAIILAAIITGMFVLIAALITNPLLREQPAQSSDNLILATPAARPLPVPGVVLPTVTTNALPTAIPHELTIAPAQIVSTPEPKVGLSGPWIATNGGLTLTVERIESGSGIFRVWMKASNSTQDQLTLPLYGYFHVVDDSGHQYEADSFSSTFPAEIASGASVAGYANMKEQLNSSASKLKVAFSTVFGSQSIRSIAVDDIALR